jgi:predicted nucleotidyltransferase
MDTFFNGHISRVERQVAAMFVIKDAEGGIKEAVRRIIERFHPVKIILFGSRARGESRPWSDADLLVVMPVKGSRRDAATSIDLVLSGIRLPMDIIVVTPDDVERGRRVIGSIIQTALREGKVLHEVAA